MGWLGQRRGFEVIEGVLSAEQTSGLIRFVEEHASAKLGRGGVRNLLEYPAMQELASGSILRGLVSEALGAGGSLCAGSSSTRPRKPTGKCLGTRM